MNTLSANTAPRLRSLRVLLPLPVGEGYDYLPARDIKEDIPQGTFVRVPLGSRQSVGVVWGEGTSRIDAGKLKTIESCLDLPPLSAPLRRFVDWVAAYTLAPPGTVLKMVLGGTLRPLKDGDRLSVFKKALTENAKELTEEQCIAAQRLVEKTENGGFSATLLDGVTGSGKTEVYAKALSACFAQGKQALVLLPEIAMTAALFDRLAARFGAAPTLWHSGLTEKQRRLTWHAVQRADASFILGARSALFLPYADLGAIVVDEEHEASYKQEEGVVYHARDMAVVRARCENIPVILASATPSLETLNNVRLGKYDSLVLPRRFGSAGMPTVDVIDLRAQKLSAQTFLSAPLVEALQETLEKGRQSMLFLNRRGYAPLTLCRGCGLRIQCVQCTSWMIEHKRTGKLHCHQCGAMRAVPKICPSCGAENKFAACGPGVERIAEEVKTRLPNIRFAVLASDTLEGPEAMRAHVKQMEDGALDLLIGTQIMAKGYHFPRLTLVGVVDADLGLGGGDPRAAERTFQLLHQVGGRAGRAQDQGRVLLQTFAPEHPVIKALAKGDRDGFLRAEMKERATYHLPPFGRLASVTLSGRDQTQVFEAARKLASLAPQGETFRVLGPAPAPFAVLRGQTRYRLMVQSFDKEPLSALVRAWLSGVSLPRTLRIQIDIDPYSFL